MSNRSIITFTVTGDLSDFRRFRLAFEREWKAFKKLDGQKVTIIFDEDGRFVSPSMITLMREAMNPPSVKDTQAILGPAHRDLYTGAPIGLPRRERIEAVKRSLFDYSREKATAAMRQALSKRNMRETVMARFNARPSPDNAFLQLAMESYRRTRR